MHYISNIRLCSFFISKDYAISSVVKDYAISSLVKDYLILLAVKAKIM